MKILFIGGTGRLSSDVAQKAVNDGNEVYIITRGSAIRKSFVDSRYKMLYTDIKNYEDAVKKIQKHKFDIVVDFLSYKTEDLINTLNIIDGHYFQYIFISTATVYKKHSENELISEETTMIGNSTWKYSYDKFLCEKYLADYFLNRNEKYTIVRPYVTYNKTRIPYPLEPQDPLYEYSIIKRIKDNKAILTFDNGNTATTITHSKDFADGINGLFMNQHAFNEAFHITSSEKVTWGQVLKYIGEYYDKRIKTVDLPISTISHRYSEYSQILNGDKGHTMLFNSSKIKSVVQDFKCNIKLRQGIFEVLDFYEKHVEFQRIDYMWYGRMDKITNSSKMNEFNCQSDKLKYYIGYYSLLYNTYILIKKIKKKVIK